MSLKVPYPWGDIAARQFDWVERMNWHKKSFLEAVALIGSEIGEAVEEASGTVPTTAFGEELADIVLRLLDLGIWLNCDLKSNYLEAKKTRTSNNEESTKEKLALLMPDVGHLANCFRGDKPCGYAGSCIARLVLGVEDIARVSDIDLFEECERKIKINEERGTRGRNK